MAARVAQEDRGRTRVMHVVAAGDIGGAERLLVDLATRPERTAADHEICLFTPNPALAAYFASAGLTVHDRGTVRENPLAYLYRALAPADVRWLVGRLVERRTQVVHTHTFGSHVLGTRAAMRARLPQLRTEHHVMHYFDPTCSTFTRWAAARTTAFVAVSEYVRSVLADTAPAVVARTRVVRNGIDTDYFAPRDRGPEPALPSPGADGFRLGIVCRLTAWKRVDLAIEATALARADLLVVGDGEDRLRLESLARRRGARATFVGHQADPRPYIAACDAILSTARDEPLGLSLLEALAMERPVIAIAGGGVSEIVHDETTGVIVPEPTAVALAATIARVSRDPAKLRRMGRLGRGFATDQGSIERTCEGYADAYGAVSGA